MFVDMVVGRRFEQSVCVPQGRVDILLPATSTSSCTSNEAGLPGLIGHGSTRGMHQESVISFPLTFTMDAAADAPSPRTRTQTPAK